MSILKKYEKLLLFILGVALIPIVFPFLINCIEIILKSGRIIGTLIRIF